MSDQIPLHELNQHLFADLMPATHGKAPEPEAKPRRKAKPDAEAEQAAPEE